MQLGKEMCCVLSMSGLLRVLNSLAISSLIYCHQSAVAYEINAFNLCSESHCEHCSDSQILKCSNGAVSSLVGDLCGCCHSCVKFRDFEESCGAQLAVRALEKFNGSKTRVTVLATTSCRQGLICENFFCKKLTEKVKAAMNSGEFFDGWTNVIPVKKPSEIGQHRNQETQSLDSQYMEDDVSATRMKRIISTSLPIAWTRKIFGANTKADIKSRKTTLFDPSGHLINLLVSGREFQLIYGHEPLADLNLLINSIDENHASPIIKNEELEILNDKFTDVIWYIANNTMKLKHEKTVQPSSRVLALENQIKNESFEYRDSKKDTNVIQVQHKRVPHIHGSKHSKIKSVVQDVRKKRQLNEPETSDDIKVEVPMSKGQEENDLEIKKQYSGISVYDIVNKSPRQIENFSRWLWARNVDTNFQSRPRLFAALDNDVNGSEINIHIAGVPRPTNSGTKDLEIEEKDEKIARIDRMSVKSSKEFDDFGTFVSEASTDVPIIMNMEMRTSDNFTKSELSRNPKDERNDEIVNKTDNNPLNINQKAQFLNTTNYEFTFPESPISIQDTNYHDVDITVNETGDEFKAQLDRIETRTSIIENAVFDLIKKINNNERYQKTDNRNDPILGKTDQEDDNHFFDNVAIREHAGKISSTNANPTDLSFFSNIFKSKDFVEDTLVEAFNPVRLNSHWRTIRRNASEAAKNSKTRRRRPDRSDRKVIESEMISRRSRGYENGTESNRRRQTTSPRRPSTIKLMQNSGKALEDRKFPIFLTNDDSNNANLFHYQHDNLPLFSNDEFNLEISSNSPAQQSVRPFSRIVSPAFSADQSDRKIEEEMRTDRLNSKSVDSMLEESMILLETQIPRSTKSTSSMVSNDPIGQSSLRFLAKYGNGLDEHAADGKSSFNLFVVDGEHSRGSRVPETVISPIVTFDTNVNQQGDQEVDVSYSLFPAYLDYVERSEMKNKKDESVVESSPSSVNPQRNQSVNLAAMRSKRDDKNVLFKMNHDNDTKGDEVIPGASEKSKLTSSLKNNQSDSEKLIDTHINIFDAAAESSSKKRSRRSVQMVDWLRAAQEYHERLRQVKIAAIKTWLASRDIASDANLTNVKLFSREVPPYLEKYKPNNFRENFDDFSGESSQDYRMQSDDSADWAEDMSDILTDIYIDDNVPGENDSEPEMSENDEVRFIEVSSSSGPRKFTITTNGNSTIRIEETFQHNNVTKFEDQLAEGSTNRETSHESPDVLSYVDYFDHMYESFDTDDEDFNYKDSYPAISGWLNGFDVIENSNVEVSNEDEKSGVKSDEAEQEDSSTRFKRDSPFVLFKVRGKTKKDIVIWPSRWMDLMHRHLKLNRTGSTPQRTTKRRSYLRPRKIDSKFISSSFESITESDLVNEH